MSRISWTEYFMSLALLSAKRSADPVTQVGACIVDTKNKVVSIGYNGMPSGCDFTWEKGSGLNNKNLFVCHAELNAILNAIDLNRLIDATIYVTLFPCNECAKAIIQSGIKKVVYLSDFKAGQLVNQASKKLLEAAGVEVIAYDGKYTKLILSK